MSYRSVKTANLRNKEKVHECWNQHLSQLYKQKLRHFLSSQIICKPESLENDAANRLDEVKCMLGREHWDEIAINRASMGFCGWMQCCSPSDPKSRSLFQLRLVVDTDMDRDVIDSFHSFKCFQQFSRVRMQLNEKPAAFCQVPKSLKSEYDLQEFGRTLSDDERLQQVSEAVAKCASRICTETLNPVTPAVAETPPVPPPPKPIFLQGLLETIGEDPPRGCRTSVCSPNRSVGPHLFESLKKKRGKGQLERKDWMEFRPEQEILDELGLPRRHICKSATECPPVSGTPNATREEGENMMMLFEYQSSETAPNSVGTEQSIQLARNGSGTVDSSGESALLLSSVNSSDSTNGESSRCPLISAMKKPDAGGLRNIGKHQKNVRWAEQLEESFQELEWDSGSLDYFSDLSALLEISEDVE